MPIQRRLPKVGFSSRKARVTDEIRLNELALVNAPEIDMVSLRAAGLITSVIRDVKIILSGKIEKPVTVRGLRVTRGAREAIIAAGGQIIEADA